MLFGSNWGAYNPPLGKLSVDIHSLAIEDRLDLIEQIWEGLCANPQSVPLTVAQREELDRRLDEMETDGGDGIPWEQVLDRIRARG
jgi:putative addiction module component (TIGR02574 family)